MAQTPGDYELGHSTAKERPMRTTTRPIHWIALPILTLALSLAAGATTAAPSSRASANSYLGAEPPATHSAALPDPGELERFLDGVFAEQLERYHIPGATVSVVQDGALLVAR